MHAPQIATEPAKHVVISSVVDCMVLLRNFAALALAAPLAAQITTGSVSGFVVDPADMPVAKARIAAVDNTRALTRYAYSDSAGYYRIDDLEPASYTLSVSAVGLAPARADIGVRVNSQARVDFRMAVASLHQSVQVAAVVSGVPTESSDLGLVIDQARIQQLPLNDRMFLQLALLAPGVTTPVEGSELSTRGEFAMHANGAREEFNNYLLDGVDNNDQNVNRYILQPPVDAVREFKIATSNYSAEYGRSAGAQINIVTRSGGNEFHGLLYEYLRNRDLDARNFFDGDEKAKHVRNQFGADLGGPVTRNRLFFFASLDALRDRQGLTTIGSVPTATVRTGDLSDLGTAIVDPLSGVPFPGNRIPLSRVSPLAAKVLALFPSPNLPGDSGNYFSQPVESTNNLQAGGRLDYSIGAIDRLSLRYSYGKNDMIEPFAESSTQIPGFGDIPQDTGQNAMVHHLHTLSPRSTNSLIVGMNRATRRIEQQNYDVDVNKLWGVNYLPQDPLDFGYPGIGVAGYSYVGDITQVPIDRTETTCQIGDTFSLMWRSHALKFGADILRRQFNGTLHLLSRGTMDFSGQLSGSGIGDLLLGLPSLDIQAQNDNPQAQRTSEYAGFVQDDWKVRPNLSINLGLRYEFNTPVTDRNNGMSVFDPQTGALTQVGAGGSSRSGYQPDWTNFAPRVGFAYSPAAGFVIRGGYGIYYDSGTTVVNSSLYFNPPYFVLQTFFPSQTSLLTLSDPFPTNQGYTPPPALSALSNSIATAYVQSWNVNLQREFPRVGTVSVAYAGSKGTHLFRSLDLNQPYPGPGPLDSREPYPEYSNIFYTETGANSSYQSLQIFLNRPLARGLSLLASFTFSKSIDDTSAFLGDTPDPNFPQNSHDYGAEHALSSFDTPLRLTVAYVYRLPGRSWWNRNMETRGIISAQSGQPFTPILQFDNSNTGNNGGTAGSDRPNVVGNPALDDPSPAEWFNTAAFAVPPPYTFGDAGRNILRGPGLFTVDESVLREFHFREHCTLSFEAQFFNLLNHVNFELPQLYADDPDTFGRIFSAKAPRQLQFAVRIRF